jgi:5-formyltetrahydrofolate cyclo-ligase
MEQTKQEIRLKYKLLRKKMSETQIEDASISIVNHIMNLPIWDKTYFHVFLPIIEHQEVNTELLLHLLTGKDKEIIVSKSDFETRQMTHFLLTENTRIKKNEYNIPEPVDGIEVPSKKIEVVFVPLLGYDKLGNRVGYGKGFYDKFLSECQPDVIKIGMSFFNPEELIIDIFENDIKLDYCVTPNEIYHF